MDITCNLFMICNWTYPTAMYTCICHYDYTIELKEDAKHYQANLYPIPKIYKPTLKKEDID